MRSIGCSKCISVTDDLNCMNLAMLTFDIFPCTQFQTLVQCLNLVTQVLNSYSAIKSIVVFNLEVDLAFPTTRYDISKESSPLMTDLRPDLYISNLELLEFEKLLENITTSYSYNSLATYVLISTNCLTRNKIFSPHISKIVLVNSSVFEKSVNIFGMLKPSLHERPEYEKEGKNDVEGILKEVDRMPFPTMNIKFCFGDLWFPFLMCFNCSKNRGIMTEIFDMFMDYMGQTPSYIYMKSQAPTRDLLLQEKCDIFPSSWSPENSLVDFLFAINDNYDYWYVPRSPATPTWKYMLEALPINIWLIWFTVLIVGSLLKWTLSRNTKDLVSNEHHPWTVLEIVSKYFLQQQARTNTTLYSSMCFFYGIAISAFILNLIYKTSFTSLLLGHTFYPQDIKTIHDAAARGLFVTYAIHLRNDLQNLYPELTDYFTSNFVISDEQGWVNMVAFRKDTIALKTRISAEYLIKKYYLDENGISLIDVLKKPAQKSLSAYVFLKGHPILSKMPKFIHRLGDHGFMRWILSKYDMEKCDYVNDVRLRKLVFKQTRGFFLIWFVGSSIGCFTLFLEFLIPKIHVE